MADLFEIFLYAYNGKKVCINQIEVTFIAYGHIFNNFKLNPPNSVKFVEAHGLKNDEIILSINEELIFHPNNYEFVNSHFK